ncbi:fungal-specific transcription factor domain-containing protein [Aspergillus falconensis]
MPRFEYLGESTGLFLLQDEYDDMDIHHPLSYGSSSLVRRLGPYQIADLMRRGAFTIPGKPLRDELVSEFFRWVAPNLPIVNKKFFLYQYETWQRGSRPSLLLLQAMFLSASKVSTSPLLLRAIGSNLAASAIFYQRAKALYDADYEPDRVIVLQSLLLMGLHCEDPRGVGTTFYWSRIAIAVAQSIGLHRSVTTSNLSLPEKRLYKRIWWTLVVRDRLTSVCLGRPMGIDLEDCDVEMLEESDFLDEDEHASSPEVVSPGQLHAKFAVQHLKLSKIMGQIFSAYYSTSSRPEAQTHLEYDRRLTAWLQQRPPELIWHKTAREYWASVLHLHYCTAICLLHKAHMSTRPDMTLSEVHLSRGAAYDAADSITDIIEGLISNGELRYCPPFILHSLYSALLIHAHRITKGNGHELFPMRSGAEVCLKACQELSGSWTAASLTYGVFSHLLSSKLRWEGSSTQSDVSFETPDGLSLTGVDPTLDRFDAFGL